ncbi:hypothetical protein GQ600_6157 [Phytophthora cactorum]|nr:hypothetical protein GQ600_6157 [Phytophthora cactorum]
MHVRWQRIFSLMSFPHTFNSWCVSAAPQCSTHSSRQHINLYTTVQESETLKLAEHDANITDIIDIRMNSSQHDIVATPRGIPLQCYSTILQVAIIEKSTIKMPDSNKNKHTLSRLLTRTELSSLPENGRWACVTVDALRA